MIGVLLLVTATAAATDYLACLWQRARERRAYAHGASLSAALELVQWVPVVFALEGGAPLAWIVVASVAGSVLGTLLGFAFDDAKIPVARVLK